MKANEGKSLDIDIDGVLYSRFPIRTHLISKGENLLEISTKYAGPKVTQGDVVVISERVIAIAQGRSFLVSEIMPGWWARRLWKFVHKHPGGIGLRSPWTMQLAIQEAGVKRILLAAVMAVLTKPFGMRGMFYRVAGHDVNAIDGPCDYSLPPSNKSAKLGPKDPKKVARQIADTLGCGAVVIDANDYGINVMGASRGVDVKLVQKAFQDNPMGQADEQTPIVILRKHTEES